MAQVGFTAVPVEVPTTELARYEKALCNSEGLPLTPANAKAVAARVVLARVQQQELAERVQAVPPIEAPK